MQIKVSAQADHPLFVWSLLLLKSDEPIFFLLYRRVTGGGGGGLSSTQPFASYPYSNFLKYPLCCLLAQAIFKMSSVSVINL